MPEGSQPAYEIALTHFIVSGDVERSRRFYTEVPGGKTIRSGERVYVALASSWIIINVGGGPRCRHRRPCQPETLQGRSPGQGCPSFPGSDARLSGGQLRYCGYRPDASGYNGDVVTQLTAAPCRLGIRGYERQSPDAS
jgi:hypothetical protein